MAIIAGLLTSATAATNDLVGEFQEAVFVRNSKGMNAGSTLFGLMAKLKTESSDNTEFNWFERPPLLRTIYANANNATLTGGGSLVISCDDGQGGDIYQYLAQGNILKNERTGEFYRVSADPTSSSAIAVVRGASGTTVTAILISDAITIITLAKDEGALPTRAMYADPSQLTNYIQTFNSSVNLSNAFKGQVLRTDIDGPLRERRIQALEKVAKDIELALLFGKKDRAAGQNGFIYSTGGIQDTVDSAGLSGINSLNGLKGTGVDYDTFSAWLRSFMVYGSDAKLAFCGPLAYSAISSFAMKLHGFQVYQSENVFGINITEVLTPFGTLSLTLHPLFQDLVSYNDWMIVVDLAHIVQKTFEPLFLQPDIQTPGQDSYQEQYRAKLGLKVKFPQAHGYAYGLQKILTPTC
jgi:hypothetical protein